MLILQKFYSNLPGAHEVYCNSIGEYNKCMGMGGPKIDFNFILVLLNLFLQRKMIIFSLWTKSSANKIGKPYFLDEIIPVSNKLRANFTFVFSHNLSQFFQSEFKVQSYGSRSFGSELNSINDSINFL